jgi:hypothetical protein
MNERALPFWRKALPVFIQVVGYLTILYALLMSAGMLMAIGMSLYNGGTGSFEMATPLGRKYYQNGSETEPLLIQAFMVITLFVVSGLIFFSGLRMIRATNEKGLAEFSSLVALFCTIWAPFVLYSIIGQARFVSLIGLPLEIAAYCIVRLNLYSLLKRILLHKGLLEADFSTSSV